MGGSMSRILPGLYIGNLHDATDEEEMARNNITHILSIHDNARPLLIDKVYLCINASDSLEQDMLCHIPECNDFIHNARLSGGAVLVHCLAGVSRSATIVIAYVMTMTGLDWRSATTAVQAARNFVNPNFSFQRQLLKYEHEMCAQEAARLKRRYGESPFEDKSECRRLIGESLKKDQAASVSTVSSANSYPFAPNTSRRLPEYEDAQYMARDSQSGPAATDVLRTVVRANRMGKAYDKATASDKPSTSSPKHDSATTSSPKHDGATSSSPKRDNASTSSPKRDNAMTSSPKRDNATAPSAKRDSTSTSSTKRDNSIPSSTKRDSSIASSTKRDNSITSTLSTIKSIPPQSTTTLQSFGSTSQEVDELFAATASTSKTPQKKIM